MYKNSEIKKYDYRSILEETLLESLLDDTDDNYPPYVSNKDIAIQLEWIINVWSKLVCVVINEMLNNMKFLHKYTYQCKRLGTKLDFKGLLNHLHLIRLSQYKKEQMKVLQKVFEFYVIQNEYR